VPGHRCPGQCLWKETPLERENIAREEKAHPCARPRSSRTGGRGQQTGPARACPRKEKKTRRAAVQHASSSTRRAGTHCDAENGGHGRGGLAGEGGGHEQGVSVGWREPGAGVWRRERPSAGSARAAPPCSELDLDSAHALEPTRSQHARSHRPHRRRSPRPRCVHARLGARLRRLVQVCHRPPPASCSQLTWLRLARDRENAQESGYSTVNRRGPFR
jgi:hypothetical protein